MNQDIKNKAEALKYAIEFTAEDGKPNYKAAQELYDFICRNLSVYEGAVEEAQNPQCSVIAEGTKEKELPLYNISCVREESKYIHKLLHNRGYKSVSRMSSNGFRERLFRLEDDYECLNISIERIPQVVAQPRPDTIVVNDTELEVADVRRYLLARGYKISEGVNEPKTYVHPKLNIKIAFV